MRWFADAALLAVVLVWGVSFPLVQETVRAWPVSAFLALRFAIATLAFAPVLLTTRGRPWRSCLFPGFLAGLCLLLGFWLQTEGLPSTTSANAGFLTGISVVLVPLGARACLGHRLRWAEVLGIGLVCLGLAPLCLNEGFTLRAGDRLVLGCAFAFAAQILIVGHYAPRLDPIRFTAVQVATAALGTFAVAALQPLPPALPAGVLGAAAFTGILATTMAFGVQTWAQGFTTPVHTALIFSLEPACAALMGWWWAGERLTFVQLGGAGLMLLGMLCGALGALGGASKPATAPTSSP